MYATQMMCLDFANETRRNILVTILAVSEISIQKAFLFYQCPQGTKHNVRPDELPVHIRQGVNSPEPSQGHA